MSDFGQRLQLAAQLEEPFIKAFNELCTTHKVIKYGIESTKLKEAHQYIRFSQDETSKFIRYIPDSVLVSTGTAKQDTTLIEFKAAKTGILKDSFFNRQCQDCPNIDPPFGTRADMFNIEADAWLLYKKLQEIGVRVVIVAHAAYRQDNPLRAQYVEKIAFCNFYNPNRGAGSQGSGTNLANVNLASFDLMPDFFNQQLNIDIDIATKINDTVMQAF